MRRWMAFQTGRGGSHRRSTSALSRLALAGIALLVAATAVAAAPEQADDAARQAQIQAKTRALARANSAVVGLHSVAIEDAASIKSLGRERQGSGVVIDDNDGLVLTIGYLILEADQVELELEGGRVFPARVIAYDQASGFGLVQSLAPLPVPSAPLGHSATLDGNEPLMIASGGVDGDLSLAKLLSKRPYSGYWEYHLDSALFTAPPRADHSGAALFNADGELLGIGSLVVNDAAGPGQPPFPGNMFVPIDLLKPILGELRQLGSSRLSHRAWMGVNCIERAGEVRVVRVADDGPADVAGLLPGDQIVAVDGTAVLSLESFYKALWRGNSPEREVKLEIRRAGEPQTLKVQATDRQNSFRKAQGI